MPRIRPARFVHVVYRTRQFDKMIAWYQAVFDCKVQYQIRCSRSSPTTTNTTGSP